MKIAFYGESPADQAAMAILTEGILGVKLEPINMDLQANGVTRVLAGLDGVFRGLHFNSDADALGFARQIAFWGDLHFRAANYISAYFTCAGRIGGKDAATIIGRASDAMERK
jgi:hypothetical protein